MNKVSSSNSKFLIITLSLLLTSALAFSVSYDSRYAYIFLTFALAFAAVRILRLSLIDLIVILLPVMFYLGTGGFLINISLADFFLPLLIFYMIHNKKYVQTFKNSFKSHKIIYIYVYILIFSMVFSLFISLLFGNPSFYGILSILKMAINMLYLITFLLILKTETSEKINRLLKVWTWTASIFSLSCIIAVLLFKQGIDLGLTMSFRATGTFEDPNLAAAYLLISLGITFTYNYSRTKKLLNLHVILILIALILTASRSGALGLGMALILMVLFSWKNNGARKILLLTILLSAMGTAGIVLSINLSGSNMFAQAFDRVSTFGSGDEGTSYRFLLWSAAVELFKQNPLFGVGIGNYMGSARQIFSNISNIPHNTYLSFLAETGLFGFFSFIWLPFILGFRLFVNVVKNNAFSAFYFLPFVAIAVLSFSINLENFRVLWVFLALIYALNYSNHSKNKKKQEN